jgi:hypothetical protein
MNRLLFILALWLAGCATPPAGGPPPSAQQQALNTAIPACKGIAAAIAATDQAVLSGALKGKDKDNAIRGLATAQAGCVATLAALQSAAAASGASQ